MGRPLLADPDFPNKAKAGRADTIRPCMACNQGCLANTFFDKPVKCLVNGLCGREYQIKEEPTQHPQRLLVIGGGPAGCEFAIRAAQRGHQVTLWEGSNTLGGQLNLTAKCPAKYEFATLVSYYTTMLRESGVQVELNHFGTPENIAAAGFDQVILAQGGSPNHTPLPEGEAGSPVVCTSTQVLRGEVIPGTNVVVVGGSFVGCGVAQYLARGGSVSPEQLFYLAAFRGETMDTLERMLNETDRKVTLVEQGPKIGFGFEPGTGWPTLMDLSRLGVGQWKNSKVTALHKNSVTVERTDKEGNTQVVEVPCDTVVTATGVHPDHSLEEALAARGVKVTAIGNAKELGRAISAISQAAELGATI
jgi:2,4-dienoyl-CoA reductase (NADPH2)